MSKNLRYIERKMIAEGLKLKLSKTEIAHSLGLSVSTIYRELKRNTKKNGVYDPEFAHKLAKARKKRVGSLPKKATIQSKKKVYRLYADRRLIYWFSDSPIGRKPQSNFLVPISFGKNYQARLGKKTFHFYQDATLFLLLLKYESWAFPTMVDVLYQPFLKRKKMITFQNTESKATPYQITIRAA
ncbi:helix-turn-helix domain-containing protein [Sediminitomix flava]|uniref:Helix-turn-helix protein n=1 Tax=Sediminitomix flava TaxID=379075 RepID=A0A315ZCL0_SEDFL|nr:helix-turn-helix domain-containing protein [Sediminitomix flava]PWJ43316.1 helix-turn-helix protein [Sediminitomix flava]